MTNNLRLSGWILAIILAAASVFYVASLTPDSFGYYHDDGIYVTTAKALATGQGYRIISLPYEPAQTKYPPFYPFLLSLVWRADPQFPQNLFLMMFFSLIMTIVFLTLTWLYLTNENYTTAWEALLVVAVAAINWRTLILATGIYSEMVYSALSIAGLWLAETDEGKRRPWFKMGTLSMVVGLAFLTRTSGISLVIAVILSYLFRKKFREASLMLGTGGSFVLTWIVWCAISATKVETISAAYYTSYLRDFAGRVDSLGTLAKVAGINIFTLLLTSVPLVSLGMSYTTLQNFTEGYLIVSNLIFVSLVFLVIIGGFIRHIASGFRLLHLYILFYLGLHLAWPFTAYDRFLVPILPFLLLFFIKEFKTMADLARKEFAPTAPGRVRGKFSATFVGLLLFAAASVGIYNYAAGIYRSTVAKEWFSRRASEDRQAIDWINANTDLSSVLVCYRDPQYYLYTGRKAVRSFTPRSSAQGQIDEPEKVILRIIKESGGQYLILTSSDFEQENQPDLIRKTYETLVKDFPQTFVPKFRSADGRTAIYYIQRHGSHIIGSS